MATVLIHAGMPKTGSTSIQSWLSAHADVLRQRHGISLVVESHDRHGSLHFDEVAAGSDPVSTEFVMRYYLNQKRSVPGGGRLEDLTAGYAAALDGAMSRLGTVLITAEGYSPFFQNAEEAFLLALEGLAQRHDVRVVYYVRPQDTALEARWCQWAHLTRPRPAAWVRSQSQALDYWRIWQDVQRIAPTVSFELRPFRRDLLDGNDAVADFAAGFLRLADPPATGGRDENVGLPLDLVNALSGAPREATDTPFGSKEGSGRIQLVAQLARSWEIPASAAAQRSRQVLRSHAHDEFERGNRKLIEALGWPTDHFVAPLEGDSGPAPVDLGELDSLWEPGASPAVASYLANALDEVHRAVTSPCARCGERGSVDGEPVA